MNFKYRPPTPEPCKRCPFRLIALAGWLGDSSPEGFIECIQREDPLPCHSSIDYRRADWKEKWLAGKLGKTCSGSLALMENMCKRPRDPAFPKLPEGVDRSKVFPTAQAFIDHHRAGPSKSWDDNE